MIIAIVLLIVVITLYFSYQMLYVQPNQLAIEKIVIKSSKIQNKALKICQISDLHIGRYYSLERFEQLIKRVNDLSPDLIVMTGDMLDNTSSYWDYPGLISTVNQFSAPLGVYAILGNHERKYQQVTRMIDALKDSNVKLLINFGDCIKTDYCHIHLYGADCAMYGQVTTDFIYPNPSVAFNLLLLHQPDAVDDYLSLPIDLVLSGHTHNGQVNFGGFKPIKPRLGRKYVEGLHHHKGQYSDVPHYINRGIGMTCLPIRLNSIPEITLISLES